VGFRRSAPTPAVRRNFWPNAIFFGFFFKRNIVCGRVPTAKVYFFLEKMVHHYGGNESSKIPTPSFPQPPLVPNLNL
jgi:hypothetical protein